MKRLFLVFCLFLTVSKVAITNAETDSTSANSDAIKEEQRLAELRKIKFSNLKKEIRRTVTNSNSISVAKQVSDDNGVTWYEGNMQFKSNSVLKVRYAIVNHTESAISNIVLTDENNSGGDIDLGADDDIATINVANVPANDSAIIQVADYNYSLPNNSDEYQFSSIVTATGDLASNQVFTSQIYRTTVYRDGVTPTYDSLTKTSEVKYREDTHKPYVLTTISVLGRKVIKDKSIDLVLVLDDSGSMQEKMSRLRTATKNLIDEVITASSNSRIAAIKFGSHVETIFNFSSNKDAMKNEIDDYEHDAGGTYIQGGIDEAYNIIDSRTDTTRDAYVLILSDGQPTYAYVKNNTHYKKISFNFGSWYSPLNLTDKKIGNGYLEWDDYNSYKYIKENDIYVEAKYKILKQATYMAAQELQQIAKIFSIGFNVDEDDNEFFEDLASDIIGTQTYFSVDKNGNLNQVFQNIGQSIASDLESYIIEDNLPVDANNLAVNSYFDVIVPSDAIDNGDGTYSWNASTNSQQSEMIVYRAENSSKIKWNISGTAELFHEITYESEFNDNFDIDKYADDNEPAYVYDDENNLIKDVNLNGDTYTTYTDIDGNTIVEHEPIPIGDVEAFKVLYYADYDVSGETHSGNTPIPLHKLEFAGSTIEVLDNCGRDESSSDKLILTHYLFEDWRVHYSDNCSDDKFQCGGDLLIMPRHDLEMHAHWNHNPLANNIYFEVKKDENHPFIEDFENSYCDGADHDYIEDLSGNDSLDRVRILSLPSHGHLEYNGELLTASPNSFNSTNSSTIPLDINAADIGGLVYYPGEDGAKDDSFEFLLIANNDDSATSDVATVNISIITYATNLETKLDNNIFSWSCNEDACIAYYELQQFVKNEWRTIEFVVQGSEYSVYVEDENATYRLVSSDYEGVKNYYSNSELKTYYNLHAGWNMISIPYSDANISEIYDTSTEIWIWEDGMYSRVTSELKPQKGYWIFVEKETMGLKVTGKVTALNEFYVKEGWNMVGPTRAADMPSSHIMFHWQNNSSKMQQGDRLHPGQGYWLYSTKNSNVQVR